VLASGFFQFFLFFFIFFYFFEFFYFLKFFKKIKNLPCVKMTSCHVDTCHYYGRCDFLILNLVPVF